VAKRSDRRARRQAAAGGAAAAPKAPEPASPPAVYATRQFWLGVLAAACLLVPAVVAAAAIGGGGDDEPSAPAAATSEEDSAQREAERLRRATQTRDKQQVQELTDRMRGYADELGPVVDGVGRTLPPERENAIGPLAEPDEVAGWVRTARSAHEFLAESVSGETGTNVARGAFASAVDALVQMTETYRLALEQPGVREQLFERVRGQRDVALRAWETGTVQLDAINIAVGFGHQHVATLGAGGRPPDSLPEGTGATEDG
jgi:hypothetical protein